MQLAPPLTVLFTNVLQYVSTESVEKTKEKYDEMLNILHLIMEIFHSLNVQDLPEHFEVTALFPQIYLMFHMVM